MIVTVCAWLSCLMLTKLHEGCGGAAVGVGVAGDWMPRYPCLCHTHGLTCQVLSSNIEGVNVGEGENYGRAKRALADTFVRK